MRHFSSLDEMASATGTTLGPGSWTDIGQSRIDTFAQATGDHQWIHTDPERAATGPFKGTVAHGFLTLSLLPVLLKELYTVDGVAMAVNYGLDKVRFVTPVQSSARVRASTVIAEVQHVGDAVQVFFDTTIEVSSSDKPAAVARSIIRYFRA
ncbi:MaoC family dehydratase [Gordonia sp. KTR9]|uniref:MaoC family dehydratase n=1 Tax=Gordonia sp. KTR9 TaxID=337191 RepID=UPI00027DDC05|nr:MaoC family dehydratase [Gordonia sp. KTR9]AFR48184.1 Acyl dehydratase [Gordonia sp. KTR9]